MEPKDTLSSCSDSEEQDMQQMLQRAKILKGSFLNGLSALKSNFTRKHLQGITKSEFERAFSRIFGEDVDTFTSTFSQNMDTLEQQLTKKTILESMMRYFAFGRHLEEIHVTWAHLEKNGQDYGPTPTFLKIMFSDAGDGVTNTT
ncbi:hypothetical protein Tco_1141519 [Tanacetum coccineum]